VNNCEEIRFQTPRDWTEVEAMEFHLLKSERPWNLKISPPINVEIDGSITFMAAGTFPLPVDADEFPVTFDVQALPFLCCSTNASALPRLENSLHSASGHPCTAILHASLLDLIEGLG